MVNITEGKYTVRTVLRYILCGILIGGGGILPGVSGGVLCVIFGIYRPMMALFAHPFKTLRRYYKMFIPVMLSGILGFFLFAKVLDVIFVKYELYATCLFIGLIAGTLPSMFGDAVKHGKSRGDIPSLIIGFAVLFSILIAVRIGNAGSCIEPNAWWYLVCGIFWGLSIVVPGMTSSSILMSLGLYMPMTAGIASLDMGVIIPWCIGLAGTILLMAKIINRLFERFFSQASFCVIGIVIASTAVIIPVQYISVSGALISLACAVVGFVCAIFFNKPAKDKEEPAGE